MPGAFRIPFARGAPPPDASPPPEISPPPADGEPAPLVEPPPPPPRPLHPQRERRELARRREIELRDVGGLAVEMARRDDWRYPLLHSRCADVLAIEERIHELDAIIAASEMAARGVGVAPCECGAPILRGAHFCSNCGRPAPETPPVVTCSHCGQPLPADANFCPVCGNAVAAEAFEGDAIEDTFVEPAPPREGATGGP
jgi:hypothetical protein